MYRIAVRYTDGKRRLPKTGPVRYRFSERPFRNGPFPSDPSRIIRVNCSHAKFVTASHSPNEFDRLTKNLISCSSFLETFVAIPFHIPWESFALYERLFLVFHQFNSPNNDALARQAPTGQVRTARLSQAAGRSSHRTRMLSPFSHYFQMLIIFFQRTNRRNATTYRISSSTDHPARARRRASCVFSPRFAVPTSIACAFKPLPVKRRRASASKSPPSLRRITSK